MLSFPLKMLSIVLSGIVWVLGFGHPHFQRDESFQRIVRVFRNWKAGWLEVRLLLFYRLRRIQITIFRYVNIIYFFHTLLICVYFMFSYLLVSENNLLKLIFYWLFFYSFWLLRWKEIYRVFTTQKIVIWGQSEFLRTFL